MQFFKNRN